MMHMSFIQWFSANGTVDTSFVTTFTSDTYAFKPSSW